MEYPEDLVPINVPQDWLELRIHGVSGTPPERVLRGNPVRVKGNEMSGFYRKEGVDNLEAYSWGGLTSGMKRHAFWLLLLPFSLINVVGWMSPCPMTEIARRWHTAFSRLLALTATAMTVLFAAVLTMDLLAWRNPDPVESPGWLMAPMNWWAGVEANVRMAIATLLVTSVVVVLGLISRQTRKTYESEGVDGDHPVSMDPSPTATLDGPEMWGTTVVGTFLGPIHSGLALGIVGWLASWVEAGERAWPGMLGAALVVYSVLMVVALVFRPGLIASPGWSRYLPATGLAIVVWAFCDLLGSSITPNAMPLLPPIAGFTWIVPIVLALLIGLVALSRPWREAGRRGHGYALAAIALGALTATGSGAVLILERLFGRERMETAAFDWLAILFTVALSVVFAFVLLKWDPLGPRQSDKATGVTKRFERLHNTVREGRLIVALWGTLLLGGFITLLTVGFFTSEAPVDSALSWLRLPPLPGQPGSPALYTNVVWLLFALPVLIVAYALLRHGHWRPIAMLLVAGAVGWSIWNSLDNVGSATWNVSVVTIAGYVSLLLPAAGILLLISRARADRNLRQAVGIIWDLANLWPRWYHPWAAPPYSEISIPDLRNRIIALLSEGKKVIVSAHSQGAVLSVPVILQPPAFPMDSCAFLSYGCLIGTVYKDLFPQYYSDSSVVNVNSCINERWRNLWRSTDPLGDAIGAVESSTAASSSVAGIDRVLNHSDYQYSPEYQALIKEITRKCEGGTRGRLRVGQGR